MRRVVLPLLLVGSVLGCSAKEDPAGSGTNADDDDDGDTSGGADDDNDDDNDGASGQSQSADDGNSTTGAGESGEPDTGGGESFLLQPDGGVLNSCDPGAQDCPKGEKCTAYVSMPGGRTVDANKCVPLMGDNTFGEECTRMADNDDCAAGFFCMTDVSGHEGPGFCLEFCTVNQPCEFGGECFAFNDGALPLCEEHCDPILQDCSPGQGCYQAFEAFVCAMPGPAEGQGNDGDTCATIQGCNPGLICAGGTEGCATDQCCTPVCDLTEPDPCESPGEDCIAVLPDPPPQWQDVGACNVPA